MRGKTLSWKSSAIDQAVKIILNYIFKNIIYINNIYINYNINILYI